MQRARIAALDHTKGLLVLVMVAYHVMSIATTAERGDFAWLRFVSGSFIALTGWVIAMSMHAVHEQHHQHGRRPAQATLMRRGGKVVLMFLALNAAILATGWGNPHKAIGAAMPLAERLWVVMTQAPSHLASFLILLPIGYLLILAPLALRLHALHPWATPIAGAVAMALAAVPAVTDTSAVLSFCLLGFMGMAAGLLRPRLAWRAPAFTALPLRGRTAQTLLASVALALALTLSAHWQSSVAAQAIGIAGVLLSLVAWVQVWPAPAWVLQALALLGRYSLLAYVAQIVVIHGAYRWMGAQRMALGGQALALMLATAVAVVALCWLTDQLRRRSLTADRSYRLIFA